MTKLEVFLKSKLLDSGLVQPVSSSSKGGSIEILCRARFGQDKDWLDQVLQILLECEKFGLEVLIAKRYLLKEGRMVFGWYLKFTAKNAAELNKKVMEVFTKVDLMSKSVVSSNVPVRPAPPGVHPKKIPAPRPPQTSGPDPIPSNVSPRIKRVERKFDQESGRVTEVFEMPLPHVTKPMNIPNERGRGASSAGSAPLILRGRKA